MEISESSESADADYTSAVSLEISQEVAEQADELLRELAEDAGLDTALIVDQSGALVTGISAEENVTVEVISALVAGASGAMKTLVRELGETGEIESLHQGSERTVYLREIVRRFVFVGVADSSLPVGVIREKSNQMRGRLSELLQSIKPLEAAEDEGAPESVVVPRSLREVAMARAAERAAREPEIDDDDPLAGNDDDPVVTDEGEGFDLEKLTALDEEEVAGEEAVEVEGDTEAEEEKEEEREPTKVLEPLELDKPEIVIEAEDQEPIESPFEIEEADEEEAIVPETIVLEQGEPVESIFELEVDDPEAEDEINEGAEDEGSDNDFVSRIFEVDDDKEAGDQEETAVEAADEEEDSGIVFELDIDEDDDESAEVPSDDNTEDIEAESSEEEEIGGSGPFYF